MNEQVGAWLRSRWVETDLGGTLGFFRRFERLSDQALVINWELNEGANAVMIAGGERCELGVTIYWHDLAGYHLNYDETGELEMVNMSLTVLLRLTGNVDLMEVADFLMEDGQDVLMSVRPFLGRWIVDWKNEEGVLSGVADEILFENVDGKMKLKVVKDGQILELKMGLKVDGNEVVMSFGDWCVYFSRKVDAGAVIDIKTPGMANDFLFGELVTISEVPPRDWGLTGELDGDDF